MSSLSDPAISSITLKDHEMGQHLLVPDDENGGDLPSGPTSEKENDLVEEFVEEDHHVEHAVEDVDNNGETALMRAAKADDCKTIEELVRRNVNENKTALFLAVEKRNVCAVKALISAGASVKVVSTDCQTPLHIAAFRGSIEIAKLIGEASKEAVAATTDGNMTPLMFAALSGNCDLVEYFLECSGGVDVNAVDMLGNSALHYGARGCSLPSPATETRHLIDNATLVIARPDASTAAASLIQDAAAIPDPAAAIAATANIATLMASTDNATLKASLAEQLHHKLRHADNLAAGCDL